MNEQNGLVLCDVKYRDILQVDDLTIPLRAVTCIVGESGSGKTTLLRLLNHLISADEGTIQYRDRCLKDWDPVQLRRQVILAPQSPVMFPGTIRDNLLAGLHYAQLHTPEDKDMRKVLQRMRLSQDLSDGVDNLSGGESQRLALCRVILMQPEVLLLDEPTSALDDSTEHYVVEQLSEQCRRRDITMVMVTHSQAIARGVADVTVFVHDGRIRRVEEVAAGTPWTS